jgi:hypothetical protein
MSLQFDRSAGVYRIDYGDSFLHLHDADSDAKRMAMTAACNGYILPAMLLAGCLPDDPQ